MSEIRTIEQLRTRLEAPRAQFMELWVSAPAGKALCALINGDVGWLMYLREEGDAGFSTRNPSYHGSDGALIEYILDNGQRDSYPAAWALPVAEVQRALEHFLSCSEAAPWLTWHNDSGDGAFLDRTA